MVNANKDALYAGRLRIKHHILFPRNFTFYKWCVTKVAHCIVSVGFIFLSFRIIGFIVELSNYMRVTDEA